MAGYFDAMAGRVLGTVRKAAPIDWTPGDVDWDAEEELLAACHFRVPDVTRLARRLGLSALTVDELLDRVAIGHRDR